VVCKEFRVFVVYKAVRVFKVYKGLSVYKVLVVRMDCREFKDFRVSQVGVVCKV